MKTLASIFKYFWAKVLIAFPLCCIPLNNQQIKIIWGIILIVILDFLLGVWVAIKYKEFSSYRFGRTTKKVGMYGLAMTSVYVLSSVEPEAFGWAFRALGVFIILTEVISNFEKLGIIGMKFPTRIISVLNKDYNDMQKMSDNDDEAGRRSVAKGIIDKRNRQG